MLVESLKIFCDLIDTQSFSKTAALNSVTQSAISQQLKSLEQRQGKQLVEREKRRLNLTAEGEIFYRYARDIVRRYEEMIRRVEAMDRVVSGAVRLSAIYSVGVLELGRYLKAYLQAFPDVDLRLKYTPAEEIYADVAGGKIDLGIVAYPRPRRNVEALPFIRDRLVAICHPDHPLSLRQTIDIRDLDRRPFIAFTEETPTRQALDQLFRKHRIRPEVVMELDHIATIKNAVEVDLGVSIVPEHAAVQEEVRGTLKVLRLEGEPVLRPLGILRRKGQGLSPAARELVAVLTRREAPPDEETHPLPNVDARKGGRRRTGFSAARG